MLLFHTSYGHIARKWVVLAPDISATQPAATQVAIAGRKTSHAADVATIQLCFCNALTRFAPVQPRAQLLLTHPTPAAAQPVATLVVLQAKTITCIGRGKQLLHTVATVLACR
jgi:hypothetical protein